MAIEQDDNQENLTPNAVNEQIKVDVMPDESAKDELKEENAMKKSDQGSMLPQAQERSKPYSSDSIDRTTLQASILPGTGNVEKIRDILFGSQIREYEKRFVRIEERLNKEINKLRDDLQKRLDSLEGHINKEIELLNDLQKTEKEDRSIAVVELSKNFKDTTATIEKKIGQLEEQLNKRVRELHENVLNQSKSLSEDIHKKHEEVSTELEKQADELQTSKLDRSYMSELLMEIAMRLTDHREMNLKIDTADLFNE
jgi:DNA repair exonuclease SbcCD ATPase subunit